MNKPVAVLLCAGEGTRMNDNRTNKVCYEVAGVPVVIRSITNMKKAGIERFVVVVGSKSEKVMECLKDIDGIIYAYQPLRNGTGNAALYGLRALISTGYDGPVLISMGDKIISTDVITDLIDKYNNTKSRAVFAVQPKEFNKSGGRVCFKEDKVYGIYEMADSCLLGLAKLKDKTKESFETALDNMGVSSRKKEKIMSLALSNPDKLSDKVNINGAYFTYEDIENSKYVNTATYIFDLNTAVNTISKLNPDNAQGEIYLTDAVNLIAGEYGAEVIYIDKREKMLTFSTMDELLSLHKYFEKNTVNDKLLTASEWIDNILSWDDKIKERFEEIYGKSNNELIEERKNTIVDLLGKYINKYGDKKVVISRSPGRVNLLGRHIEHRGGSINVMSINRETLLVCGSRDDDIINLANTDPKFKEYSFSILSSIKASDTNNWLEFIENDSILQMVLDSKGEWVNYIKAAVLRLQLNNREKLMCGMDMLFTGNIPIAAGLSSSSSIVVATTEAAIVLNDMDIKAKDFIHLCGEGEWFVGSRGGAGDHAAMKCSKRDMITHLEFCPFEIKESIEFPKDYNIIVANSFIEAKKSEGAKDKFNQRVACYEFGFMLIKKLNPKYSSKLRYLKDINPDTLDISQSKIYEMLLMLPEIMTLEDVYSSLPEYKDDIDRIVKTHSVPEYYEIRSTMLYGIAECIRAEKCIELLKNKDFVSLGKLMNISHNGDRVYKDGKSYVYSVSDEYLLKLISDLKSEDINRVMAAQIYNQPGGYACSTKEIDELVDLINQQKGVLGTELSGAGLGGCVISLVKKENTQEVLDILKKKYYNKNNLPMGAQIFIPVAGSLSF